jgi:predicted O-methyltransferase YrrM
MTAYSLNDRPGPCRARLPSLLAAGPPLHADDWSLGDPELEAVLDAVACGARTVVECGSGRSTVLIARALRELGTGKVHSLEHDPAWALRCRAQLAAEGLAGVAQVIEAPLAAHSLAQPGCRWYAPWALRGLPEAGVDLLLVDGPPAGEPAIARSRYPGLPALADRLTDDAVVMLDDAVRPGERWTLERWTAEHAVRFRFAPGTGLAIGCMLAPRDARRKQRTKRSLAR